MFNTIFSGERLSFKTPGQVQRLSADDGNGPLIIGGHGAVYYDGTPGTEYTYWGTTLRLMPGCMDEAVKADKPWSFFNHDENYLLGSVEAGSMELALDERGCTYRTIINPNDPQAMSVYAKVERGDCRGSSMMFMIADSHDEKVDGKYVEWITKISPLYEMGPVVSPAMTSADSAALSEEGFARFQARREERERALAAQAQKRRRQLALAKARFR